MARIRTLKPDHKLHRKVGLLTDRQYRLWVGMITEADDDGRLNADAHQLRVMIFAYHPTRVLTKHVAADLESLAAMGLIRLYRVGEVTYADFPSWRDHQRLDRAHYTPSKLPPFHDSTTTSLPESLPIDDQETLGRQGREGNGKEGNGKEETGVIPPAPLVKGGDPAIPSKILEQLPIMKQWPNAEALVALWNHHATAASLPLVETISDRRRKKVQAALRQFPDWRFWNGAFAMCKQSRFLTGQVPPTNGHSKSFVATFDWFLANSKNGTENVVLVREGGYTK